jgi:hypothetical protein
MIGEYLDHGLFMSSFMIVPLVRESATSTLFSVKRHFCYPTSTSHASAADLRSAVDEIAAYGDLQDDWDGYGARALDPKTIRNAIAAASRLIGRAPLPDLTPNSNGTISMEWESADGLAHLEIGKSRYAFFIRMKNGERVILDGSSEDIPHLIGDAITKSMYTLPESAPTMSGSRFLSVAA